MIEQAAWYKSSSLLKNILQNTQTLQLFTKIIETETLTKVFKMPSRKAWAQRSSCLIKRGMKRTNF
jgi:hypothetical protein